MSHSAPSSKNLNVLRKAIALQKKIGRPPSVAELAEACSLVPSAAHKHLRRLERFGYVLTGEEDYGLRILRDAEGNEYAAPAFKPPRTVTVTRTITTRNAHEPSILAELYKPKPSLRLVPDISPKLAGIIAGGDPIDTATDGDELVMLPGLSAPGDDGFYVHVKGWSMLGEPWWIPDGAVVLCRRTGEAHNGDVAVIFFPEENRATLKQFFRERRRIRLQPLNLAHQPIILEGKARAGIVVQGVLVSVHHGGKKR